MLAHLIGPITGLLEKIIPDATERHRIAFELNTLAEKHAQELAKGQLAVNAVEAAHKNLFVSGWRPAVGWCCCIALMYSTIVAPILGIWFTVPPVDSSLLTTVLLGMLGLGGLRTIEKTKTVARNK